MHEAAIAKEVFDIAQQAMTENGLTRLTRLTRVVMDIGEYSAVVPEQLQFVFSDRGAQHRHGRLRARDP